MKRIEQIIVAAIGFVAALSFGLYLQHSVEIKSLQKKLQIEQNLLNELIVLLNEPEFTDGDKHA